MIKPYILTAVVFSITAPYSANAVSDGSDLAAQVRKCALLQDDAKRIGCYDLIGDSLLKSADPIKPSEDVVSAKANTDLPDTLGGGKFDTSTKETKTSRGKITSCKKTRDNRWFFFFESGQVWKQTDRRQRFFKDCDFYANLTEDGFGYKMTLEGKKSKIRVKRVR